MDDWLTQAQARCDAATDVGPWARTDLPHALELVRRFVEHAGHSSRCTFTNKPCNCGLDDLLEAVKRGPG